MVCVNVSGKSKCFQFFILLMLYFVYVNIGGIVFTYIEEDCNDHVSDHEPNIGQLFNVFDTLCSEIRMLKPDVIPDALKESIFKLKENCTRYYKYASLRSKFHCHINITQRSLSGFREEKKSKTTNCSKWTLGNHLKWTTFSSSTIFTIGYGDVTPRCFEGKIVTIIYALIGIPIALAMLSAAAEIGIHKLSKIIVIFERNILRRRNVKQDNLKTFFAALISFSLSIIISSLISTNDDLDNMTWVDALYYYFISFTTIGYGDIPVDRSVYSGWKFLIYIPIALCLIFGLALMATLLSLASRILIKGQWRRLCCCEEISRSYESDSIMYTIKNSKKIVRTTNSLERCHKDKL